MYTRRRKRTDGPAGKWTNLVKLLAQPLGATPTTAFIGHVAVAVAARVARVQRPGAEPEYMLCMCYWAFLRATATTGYRLVLPYRLIWLLASERSQNKLSVMQHGRNAFYWGPCSSESACAAGGREAPGTGRP